MNHETLVSIFWDRADAHPDESALLIKRDGEYRPVSWAELSDSVRKIAAGLLARGVEAGDRVGLLSENRQEWIEADFGIMSAGGITVALYAPLTPAQVQEQFADCAPTAAFVSTAAQCEKLASVRESIPSLRTLICFDERSKADPYGMTASGIPDAGGVPYEGRWTAEAGKSKADPYGMTASEIADAGDTADVAVLSLGELKAEGAERLESDPGCVERRVLAVTPDDLAALSYTSGTTGESKGVMLTHANLVSNVRAMEKHLVVDEEDEETVVLTFLPLNHIYARTCDLYFCLASGRVLALCESIDTILENLQEVRPHHISGVPRFHQKFSDLAKPYIEAGHTDALRKLLGGRIRWVSSGGAALAQDVHRFYFACGVPCYQGYGLTETSPVISFSKEGQSKIGASGVALEGVEIKIAEDGEILSRGPHIMKGYWNKPKATADVIDADGWFHTGDVGFLDEEGFLHITDRKKDIIVTAYGKNVAPQQIEGLLCFDPLIEQAAVFGDDRPYLVALIVPAHEALGPLAPNPGGISFEELLRTPEVMAIYESRIASALQSLASHEQVRRFRLLPEQFTADRGEMTVTAKLRRRHIAQRYREILESLYAE